MDAIITGINRVGSIGEVMITGIIWTKDMYSALIAGTRNIMTGIEGTGGEGSCSLALVRSREAGAREA